MAIPVAPCRDFSSRGGARRGVELNGTRKESGIVLVIKQIGMLALIAVVLVAALPGLAQVSDAELEEVELALRTDGFYVEAGSEDSPVGVSSALSEADSQIYIVSFASDRGEDEGILADRIAQAFSSGTFVVLTPVGIGASSNEFSDAELNKALDAAEGNWSSLAEGISELDQSLAGKGGFPWLQAVVVAVLGFFGWNIYKGRKRDKGAVLSRLEEARAGIREQVADVSNDILELSDRVATADNTEATEHFREGSAIFSGVADSVETVPTEVGLTKLSADLTEAEWSLEAAEAILDGRQIPEKPTDRPVECFFHAHRAGIEEADVKTSAGSKKVSVCRECGERLRKGEKPAASTVSVGGRRIPRNVAPKSYGGAGFDMMDAFEIFVAGGRGARYNNWGTGRPTPSRSVGSRSTSRSRSGGRSGGSRGGGSRSRVSRRRR